MPVYFIHGANDWIIKPTHSQRLFDKAKGNKKISIIEGAGHAEKIFDSKPEALAREKYLQSGQGRDYIRQKLLAS